MAKLRFGLLELALASAVLLGWTLLGGLDWLNNALMDAVGPRPLLQPLALLVAFAVINALIDLPFSLYQTFVIEERFGFNKMTLRLWLGDLLKSTLVGTAIGVPLAALLCKEALNCFQPGDQGGTFCGNPLMAAVGLAAVRFADEVSQKTGGELTVQPFSMSLLSLSETGPGLRDGMADIGYVLVQGANAHTGTGKELMANDEVRRTFLGG